MILEEPVAVTKDNIKDYIGEADFPKKEDICAGKLRRGLHGGRSGNATGTRPARRPGPSAPERRRTAT